MTIMTEQAAALLLAEHAFAPATPGFVGAEVDLPLGSPGLPDALFTALALRPTLRHGFLTARSARLAVVSGPPSPGLETCLARMADDLAGPLPLPGMAGSDHVGIVPGDGDEGGVRVSLEAGLDGGGPLGLSRRWALAGTLAPVLAAAFANSPLRDGQPTGWRSTRQARHREHPVLPPIADPRAAWAAYVLASDGPFRAAAQPRLGDLVRHVDALRPPVAARGHLEIDVADRQPGDGWRVVVAVTTALLDDPRAAAATEQITAPLAAEPRLWERAARDALTDPVLAAAARGCFVEAYGTLARHGASRDLRDTVAEFTERYVMRGRCPADDLLDARAEGVRPVPR